MGLPANPRDGCQPLGYSKAKFQWGLLCQNHMMSVLFSPDQNNQSFRLLRMVSVSKGGWHFTVRGRISTEVPRWPPRPGPGASRVSPRRATNPGLSVPATHILHRVLHTTVHSTTRNYSGSPDRVRVEHKANRSDFYK